MAKIRMVAASERRVPGLGGRTVQVDEVVTVPDAEFESYVCQAEIWQPVEEPETGTEAEPSKAAMKTVRRRAVKDGE